MSSEREPTGRWRRWTAALRSGMGHTSTGQNITGQNITGQTTTIAPEPWPWGAHAVEIVWIVVVFFLFGSGAAPEVNEPHYVGKARHFWDAAFCPGDFFLESRDVHTAYFLAFGWVTTLVSLPAAAWIGRFAGWTLLATAWHGLSVALVPQRGASLLGAALWLTLIQHFQMSGEWVVGGTEAKVFAYVFVLAGLRQWVKGRANATWVLLGISATWHVLVGGWAVVMTAVSHVMQPRSERLPALAQLPGLILGGLLALGGLIPALQLSGDTPPELTVEAEQIYVFQRLPHHLLIRDFPSLHVLRHLLLIAVFAALWRGVRRQAPATRLGGVVWGAILLVLVGASLDATLGNTALGARLLRFYWFRASDIFVPLGVTLIGMLHLKRWTDPRSGAATPVLALILVLVTANLAATTLDLQRASTPAADRQGGIRQVADLADWRDMCNWVRTQLPSDVRLLAPPDHQTFKWYAQRAEVVNWKDVPQDASGLIEWSRRLRAVQAWQASENLVESALRLQRLQRDYGFDYVIVRWPAEFPVPELPALYQNRRYRIFSVRPDTPSLEPRAPP